MGLRFASSFEGRRLLETRPSLADTLADRASLAALPAGSFGRAVLAYLDANGFQSRALVVMQHDVQRRWEAEGAAPALDPARAWIRDRLLLCHDLLHVLTDYGTDGAGEATLLAFSHAQFGGRDGLFLTLGAAAEMSRRGHVRRWLAYDWRAWRRLMSSFTSRN